jgi:UDP-glucose 4-epimerase
MRNSNRILMIGSGFLASEIRKTLHIPLHDEIVNRQLAYLHRQGEVDQAHLLQLLAKSPPEVVVNAAGPASVAQSWSHADIYLEDPAKQVAAHLELLRPLKKKPVYIFLSSGSVYGETGLEGASERDPTNPISPYAQGKLSAENILRESGNSLGIPWIILRVFSSYSRSLESRLPFEIVKKVRSQNAISLSGTGGERRDFVHVSDIAGLICCLMEKESFNQVFNIGSGKSLSILEVTDIASHCYIATGKGEVKAVEFTQISRTGDPINLVPKISKILRLGFTPQIDSRAGLEDYFSWKFTNLSP